MLDAEREKLFNRHALLLRVGTIDRKLSCPVVLGRALQVFDRECWTASDFSASCLVSDAMESGNRSDTRPSVNFLLDLNDPFFCVAFSSARALLLQWRRKNLSQRRSFYGEPIRCGNFDKVLEIVPA